jgi:hypothetical protein
LTGSSGVVSNIYQVRYWFAVPQVKNKKTLGKEVRSMAFSKVSAKSGKTYYLHSRDVTLRGGRQQTIYFFAQDVRPGALDAIPAGYEVMENARTGLPMLRKAR